MQDRSLPLLLLLFVVYTASAQQHADCVTAMQICKKQVYHIDRTGGEGNDVSEAAFVPCFLNGESMGQAEKNSTWIAFEIAKGGSLTFAIVPHREEDDIDFVVYRLPSNGDCRGKQIVRCMAAGDSQALNSPCMGATGLREGETDTSEDAGCSDAGDNNWLAPLRTAAGEKYVILISNITSRGPGFSITFGGTAKLPCDDEPPQKPERETVKVKPTPKPTPTPPTTDTLSSLKAIGGRDIEVKENIKVKARTLKLKIWDNQIEDGDVISVYLNDKKIISNLYLTNKPKEFEIELPPGREHLITVFAEDFGKAEPNTARVVISDGTKEYVIDLVAERKKQQSIKIILD